MADRLVSYVCPHCDRMFKTAHSCQRHLSRSHPGVPAASATLVLLQGLEGPEGGFSHPAMDVVAPRGTAFGGSAAEELDPAAGDSHGGLRYVADAPTLADSSVL